MRRIAVFCFLGLVATSLGRAGEVSLEFRALPVSKALPILSKAVGMPLLDSPQTKNDVILVKVSRVSPDELLKKIAEALNATWQREGSSYRLVRTTAQQRADERREAEFQIREIMKTLEKARADQAKQGVWTKTKAEALASRMAALLKTFKPDVDNGFSEKFAAVQAEVPTTAIAAQIFQHMDPAELAAIPPQIEVVYSSTPNAAQRKLNAGCLAALDKYITNLHIWQEAKEAKGVGPVQVGNTTYHFDSMDPREKALTKRPSKVLVGISRFGSEPNFNVEVTLADAQGRVLSKTTTVVQRDFGGETWADVAPTPGEPSIHLRPEDAVSFRFMSGQEVDPAVAAKIRRDWLNPAEVEPLRFMASSSLLTYAAVKQANLVAYLSDQNITGSVSEQPVSLKLFERRMDLAFTRSEENGWLTMAPSRAHHSRGTRIDRPTLAAYLRALGREAGMTLEERARFALTMPSEHENFLPGLMARALYKERDDTYLDEKYLRFYGSLTPQQVLLAKEDGLPLAALPPVQARELRSIVFGLGVDLQWSPSAETGRNIEAMKSFHESLRQEPTESFPNGIPSGAVLRISENSEEVASTFASKDPRGWTNPPRTMSAEEYAWQLFVRERPDLYPGMRVVEPEVNLDALRFGMRRRVHFELKMTPEILIQGLLFQHNFEKGDARPLSALPEQFRKAVQARMESQRKSAAKSNGGGSTG